MDDTRNPHSSIDNPSGRPEMVSADEQVSLFESHRSLLLSIGYRMLGRWCDAEDILQETFLRWREAKDIRDPRAFLVTVMTRLCINELQSARRQRELYFGQWLPEPVLTSTNSGDLNLDRIDESLSIAFLLLLERLTPAERAVFLLREVFEYEYAELAHILGQSETNCRQIFHRARRHIADERPRFNTSRDKQKKLLQRFLDTTSTGNVESLISLLTDDVILYTDGGGKATAVPNPIYGSRHVASFFMGARQRLVPSDTRRLLTDVNGQPGVVAYAGQSVFGVLSIDSTATQIRRIYIVRNPEKLAHIKDKLGQYRLEGRGL